MRYSHYIPTYVVANNMSNFVPSLYNPATAVKETTSGQIIAGSGNPYDGLETVGSGIPASQDSRVVITTICSASPQGALADCTRSRTW